MLKLDEQISKDLDALYATSVPFQRVADEWIKDSLAYYREVGDDLDGNDLYRNQGKCKILSDLLACIQTAGDVRTRFAQSEGAVED